MSRYRSGASMFEQKCIVDNAIRHPLSDGVTKVSIASYLSAIPDCNIRGDYHFETAALRQAPVFDKDDFDMVMQRSKALSNIHQILKSSPSPGFVPRFKLTELQGSLPPYLQQQKQMWLAQGKFQDSEVLAKEFDDSAYAVQSVSGRRLADIYQVSLPPIRGELPQRIQLNKQFDELWHDLVSTIYYLQHLDLHGVVHVDIGLDTIIRTSNNQIKITGLHDTFRHLQMGESPIDELNPRMYFNEVSPPEILLRQEKSYISLTPPWLVGMLAYAMATRGNRNPFGISQAVWGNYHNRLEALRGFYKKNRLAKKLAINFNYPIFYSLRGQRLQSFIETCLSPDPMTRVQMTVRKMFRHALFVMDENNLNETLKACDIDKDLAAAVNGQLFNPNNVRFMTFNAAKRYVKTRTDTGRRNAKMAANPTYKQAIRSTSTAYRVAVAAVILVAIGAAVTVAVLAPPLVVMVAVSAAAGVLVAGSMTATGVVVRQRVKKAKKHLSDLYKAPGHDDRKRKPQQGPEYEPLLSTIDSAAESKEAEKMAGGAQNNKRLSTKLSMTFAMPVDGYDTVDLDDEDEGLVQFEHKSCAI